MANWLQNNTIITNLGLTMLAKAQAGLGKMHITKVVTASLEYDESVYKDLSEWVNKLRTLEGDSLNLHLSGETSIIPVNPESSITPKGDDYDSDSANPNNAHVTQITARFSNESVTEAYKIHQVIVFMRLIDLLDAEEDLGEIPYMVAQSDGNSDYDYMPLFSDNPTAINYDLYVVHSGVANIELSVKTSGFVKEEDYIEDISEIHNIINNIQTNSVGQNTEGLTFNVWSPVYTDDSDPSGARQWSKSTETTEMSGSSSAERFNHYDDVETNIAIGANSHVEGINNVALSSANHIEGDSNHAAENTFGSHIEGRRNSTKNGWFQHVEGEFNQSVGYATHVEGTRNKVESTTSDSVGNLHIEGNFNTVKGGSLHHMEGERNTIETGEGHHVQGKDNTVKEGNYHNVSGISNTVEGSDDCNSVSGQLNHITKCNSSVVSGTNNTVTESNQTFVSGNNHKVENSNRANVSGIDNSLGNSPNTSVTGSSNVLSNSPDSICSGNNNTSTGILASIVSGINNTIETTSPDITSGKHFITGTLNHITDSFELMVSGYTNDIHMSSRSVITGRSNNMPQNDESLTPLPIGANDCLIGGEENTLTVTNRSIVVGKSNTLKNTSDSIVGGKSNNIYSDTTAECILCVGFGCTIKGKDSPIFVHGTDNTATAENVAVVGKGNIASGNDQMIIGRFNTEDLDSKYAFIVGGGTSSTNRKNILTVDWDGILRVSDIHVSNVWNADGTSKLGSWNITEGTGVGSIKANNLAGNSATGLHSTAFGNKTQASNNYSFAGGNNSIAKGQSSFAFGDSNTSNSDYSTTFGHLCTVGSLASFATGWDVTISPDCTSAFGCGYSNSVNSGAFASFTSGHLNTNCGNTSFVTGEENENSGNNAFVSGTHNTVSGKFAVFGDYNELSSSDVTNMSLISGGYNSIKSFTTDDISKIDSVLVSGSKNSIYGYSVNDVVSGSRNFLSNTECNIVSGYNNTLSGISNEMPDKYNIVSGDTNTVKSVSSVVSGKNNYVTGSWNIVNGFNNIVGSKSSPSTSHAALSNLVVGHENFSSGVDNVLLGKGLRDYPCEALSEGWDGIPGTSSVHGQLCIIGQYNDTNVNTLARNMFTVANGSSDALRYNLFAVGTTGDTFARGTYNTEGADTAEWQEWEDGNPLKHDRRGLFVTLSGDKIVLADANTKYILGIVSARPSLVGDSYEDCWNRKYLTDVFGEIIYEDYVVPAETQTIMDTNGNKTEIVITPEHVEKRPVINPDFNPDEEYIPRSKRPEWSYVSCTGKLVMVDDGTCVPDGYCRPTNGGIATASNTTEGYRVMKRIDDTHILVWTEGAIHFK